MDRRATRPPHTQVYDAFRDAILGCNLRAGQKVPSSRSLASELNVSRIPVLTAYSQLIAEGYFDARSGSGTFVSSSLPDQWLSVQKEPKAAPARVPTGRRLSSRRSTVLPEFTGRPWQNKWGPTLFPSLRLSYIVIPPDLVGPFVTVRHAMDLFT